MPSKFLRAGLFLSLLILPGSGFADHFPFPSGPPANFEAAKNMVTKTIPQYLDKAQCGGWDMTQSVTGKISVVTGVPGHTGIPLGNIQSGMGARKQICTEEKNRCTVKFSCAQSLSYDGYAQTNGGGIINLTLKKGGKISNALLRHELEHARQLCESGAPLYATNEECCAKEGKAYQAQCDMLAQDGKLNFVVDGITVNAAICADALTPLSCGRTAGLSGCPTSRAYPSGFADRILLNAAFSQTTACESLIAPATMDRRNKDVLKAIDPTNPVVTETPTPPKGEEAVCRAGTTDNFIFPDGAKGLTTVCEPNKRTIERMVWDENGKDSDGISGWFVKKTFANPFYRDAPVGPPCLWRSEAEVVTNPQPADYDGKEKQLEPPHNPPVCREFCGWLNSWKYTDCEVVVDILGPNPEAEKKQIVIEHRCVKQSERYLCSDGLVKNDELCREGIEYVSPPSDIPQVVYAGTLDLNLMSDPNSTGCVGQGCRCGPKVTGKDAQTGTPSCRFTPRATFLHFVFDLQSLNEALGEDGEEDEEEESDEDVPPIVILPTPVVEEKPEATQRPKISFFRTYQASFAREQVTTDNKTREGPKDVNRGGEIPIACYGIYTEFDPKNLRTGTPDLRCVIELDVSNRPATQKGKGAYGQNSSWKDPDIQQRKPTYDEEKDLWYPNLGGGISFLNDKIFKDRLDQDISTALLTVDAAKVTAISPFDGTKTAAAQIRAFDDTVSDERKDQRTVAEWWQAFEASAHKLFSPPIVRLLIPPTWSFGVDAKDPLLQGSAAENTRKDARMESIEVQVHAREDALGSIVGLLERSLLLRVEEEPIPVVVPLGADFRSYAQAWLTYINTLKKPDGDPLPGKEERIEDAEAYMEQLEAYAEQVERVRLLRAELPRSVGAVAKAQSNISQEIAKWTEANLTAYRNFLKGNAERLELQKTWIALQQAYVDFHDRTNMPWCRNDRFTMSLYHLLDPWMPPFGDTQTSDDRFAARDLSGKDFPVLTLPTEPDFVIDMSNLRIAAGTAKIPVLKPTFVRVRAELPRTTVPDFVIPKEPFPTFPEIPSIYKTVEKSVSKVKLTLPPPELRVPPPLNLTQALEALTQAQNIIGGMTQSYDTFWQGLPRRNDKNWKAPTCATNTNENGNSSSKPPSAGWCCPEGIPGNACVQQTKLECEGGGGIHRDTALQCAAYGCTATTEDLQSDSKGDDQEKPLQPLECCGWNQKNCVYPEVALAEVIQRITARPAVLLKEDFQSTAIGPPASASSSSRGGSSRRSSGRSSARSSMRACDPREGPCPSSASSASAAPRLCDPKDQVCLPLHPEFRTRPTGWQILFPQGTAKDTFEDLRYQMLRKTLSETGALRNGQLPYAVPVERLYPTFGVPPAVKLFPASGSSSSPRPS